MRRRLPLGRLCRQFRQGGETSCGIGEKLGGKDIIKKTVRLTDEWLAVDPKENRAEGAHKKIPCHIMLMILALSLSLLLIVSGSVLTSKAEMEMRAVKNQLGELVEYKEELEQKLEIKNDLRYIETVARTRLGMIDKSYAPLKYLGGTGGEGGNLRHRHRQPPYRTLNTAERIRIPRLTSHT